MTAELTTFADSSSQGDVKMGYFWVLDSVPSGTPRVQRLLVHSELPRPAESYAQTSYNILGSLEDAGALRLGFSSASLARITVNVTPEEVEIDAKLESLEVHYNPEAVKATMTFALGMLKPKDSEIVVSAPEPVKRAASDVSSQASFSSQDRAIRALKASRPGAGQQKLRLSASFGSLRFNMNSALDDEPLFLLGLVRMKLKLAQDGNGLRMDASLDDLSVSTPAANDRVHDSYKIILGLAPGVTSSLVSIAYFKSTPPPPGLFFTEADAELTAPYTGFEGCDTFAHVTLSKIRFVHLQAQLLMLVQYVQEGILDVLADPSSALGADQLGEVSVIPEETPPALFKVSGES